PPKQKRSNARKIPPELHGEVCRLHKERKSPQAIAEELNKLGCDCKEWSVRRTVRVLRRIHSAEKQAAALREQAVQEAHVALDMRAQHRDDWDEVIYRLMVAARKDQTERVNNF